MSEGARAFITKATDEAAEEIVAKGIKKVWTLGDMRFYECPLTYLTEDTHDLIRLLTLIDGSGPLLHAGGWGEQPIWLVEAVLIHKAEMVRRKKECQE